MSNEKKIIEVEVDITKALEKFNELNKAMEGVGKRSKESTEAQRQQKTVAKELESEYDKLVEKHKELVKEAQNVSVAQGAQSKAAKDAAKAANKLGKEIHQHNQYLMQGRQGIMAFASAGTVLPGMLGRVSFGLMRVGTALKSLLINPIFLSITALLGLVAGFVGLAKHSMEFERNMAAVKAITGATRVEMEMLKKSARDLALQSTKTAKEISELQKNLGKAGFSIQEIINMTPAIVKIGVATEESLDKVSDTVGSVIRSFGLASSDAERVGNVMAEAFMTSRLDLDKFTNSMKYAAISARSTGVSFEETSAILAVLADKGILGSLSGTALRKVFSELARETGSLEDKLRHYNEQNFTYLRAQDLAGRRAADALKIMVDEVDAIHERTIALENNTTSLENMASVMEDTLHGDLKKLKNTWSEFLYDLEDGDGLVNKLARSFVKLATVLISTFQDSINEAGRLVQNTLLSPLYELDILLLKGLKLVGRATQEEVDEAVKRYDDFRFKIYGIDLEWRKEDEENRKNDQLLAERYENDRTALLEKGLTEREKIYAKYNEEIRQIDEGLLVDKELGKALITQEEHNMIKAKLDADLKAALERLDRKHKDRLRQQLLRHFDYESRIMREQADAFGMTKEREIQLAEADYERKLEMSTEHIRKLQHQEDKGVEGAREARIKAEKKHIDYKEALDESLSTRRLQIEQKYHQLSMKQALEDEKHKYEMLRAEHYLSAQQSYDADIDMAKKQYAYDIELLNDNLAAKLISQEEYNLKVDELTNSHEEYKAQKEMELTKALHDENIKRIDNMITAYDTQSAVLAENISEIEALKREKLAEEFEMELAQVGDNEELRLSIIQKYAQKERDIDRETLQKKNENFQLWAGKSMEILSSLDQAVSASANRELQAWANANQGKIGFEEEYEARKLELQIESAKRTKALRSFETAINTAAAIVGFLADPSGTAGAALSVMAGITGAAQIAAIHAEPLPTAGFSKSSSKTSKTSKRYETEKFHTGTYRPAKKEEEREITRTLLTTERVLSPSQTAVFDRILGTMGTFGGSSAITQDIGVSGHLEEKLLERAFSSALRNMPNPVMSWSDYSSQHQRMAQLDKNRSIR